MQRQAALAYEGGTQVFRERKEKTLGGEGEEEKMRGDNGGVREQT